jgi:hypothetical protein
MATNSPVLKQFSPHVLWFSRSLRHGTQIHQFMHSSPQDILQAGLSSGKVVWVTYQMGCNCAGCPGHCSESPGLHAWNGCCRMCMLASDLMVTNLSATQPMEGARLT